MYWHKFITLKKHYSLLIFSFFAALLLCMQSCSIVDPASPTPTYLQIDSVRLLTNYAVEGSNSKNVTDVWVLVDNEYYGTFPLPCKIPIPGAGSHKITVRAGIIIDGISAMRAAYPNYAGFDTTINMEAAKVYNFIPKITYRSSAAFPNSEDFEDATQQLVLTTQGNTSYSIITPPDANVFEGNSGMVALGDTNTVFEVASVTGFALPIGTNTYVELNYKSDIDFVIGDYVTTSSISKQELLSIRASSVWKKIYININDLGGILTNAVSYKIYIRAVLPAGRTSANLYFDNFKVVY